VKVEYRVLGPLEVRDGDRLLSPSAAGLLREALALWRGTPLAEFAEPFARVEAARLEDLRLAALEARVEADLALGRHAELFGELEALISEQPLRERLRGQLMLALYRSGRSATARATDPHSGRDPRARNTENESAGPGDPFGRPRA